MPLMNSRFGAWADSALVAVSAEPASPAVVSAPVADGKKFFATTPFSATMKKVNTGEAPAAHAERSGKPSRNGSPMATAPAPLRKLRRFDRDARHIAVSALDLTLHLRYG